MSRNCLVDDEERPTQALSFDEHARDLVAVQCQDLSHKSKLQRIASC